jgi:hypothetical protein
MQEIEVQHGGNSINMDFFGSLGAGLATLVIMFLGIMFFIPGLMIILKQHKLPKEKRSTGLLVTGYTIMAVGILLGMGLAIGVFAGLMSSKTQ